LMTFFRIRTIYGHLKKEKHSVTIVKVSISISK
jgi:hypothetical protein